MFCDDGVVVMSEKGSPWLLRDSEILPREPTGHRGGGSLQNHPGKGGHW